MANNNSSDFLPNQHSESQNISGFNTDESLGGNNKDSSNKKPKGKLGKIVFLGLIAAGLGGGYTFYQHKKAVISGSSNSIQKSEQMENNSASDASSSALNVMPNMEEFTASSASGMDTPVASDVTATNDAPVASAVDTPVIASDVSANESKDNTKTNIVVPENKPASAVDNPVGNTQPQVQPQAQQPQAQQPQAQQPQAQQNQVDNEHNQDNTDTQAPNVVQGNRHIPIHSYQQSIAAKRQAAKKLLDEADALNRERNALENKLFGKTPEQQVEMLKAEIATLKQSKHKTKRVFIKKKIYKEKLNQILKHKHSKMIMKVKIKKHQKQTQIYHHKVKDVGHHKYRVLNGHHSHKVLQLHKSHHTIKGGIHHKYRVFNHKHQALNLYHYKGLHKYKLVKHQHYSILKTNKIGCSCTFCKLRKSKALINKVHQKGCSCAACVVKKTKLHQIHGHKHKHVNYVFKHGKKNVVIKNKNIHLNNQFPYSVYASSNGIVVLHHNDVNSSYVNGDTLPNGETISKIDYFHKKITTDKQTYRFK